MFHKSGELTPADVLLFYEIVCCLYSRFRKQSQIEKVTRKKGKERAKRIEGALIRESEIMPRGLQAYLVKLDKQKEKYDAKVKKSRKINRHLVEMI